MLEMSDQALAVVQRSFTMVVRAESWRSGELLADNIPVSDGSEEADRSVNVPETVAVPGMALMPVREAENDREVVDPMTMGMVIVWS